MIQEASEPLVFLVFRLEQDGFQLVEGGAFGVPNQDLNSRIYYFESEGNPGSKARRVFRVELPESAEGSGHERQIAELLRELTRMS